jgi:putative ABC transport system permease protein
LIAVLRALVLRPLVREKLRTALTVLGIAVGVAVVVAIDLSNQSALRAFGESVDAVAGRANYQIASDAALDERLLLRLQPFWLRGVRFAPVIDVDGMIEPSQQPIRLLGVDLFSDLHFREYRYAAIAAKDAFDLVRPDSLIVPQSFAQQHNLRLGSAVTLNCLGRQATLTVRGILQPRGPATAFNGSIAVVDIATAQQQFGLTGQLTRVDLIVPDDATANAIQRVLPANTRLERPSRRNERVEKMLRAFRANLYALAGIALLVGMFLVYNTVLISILRRRRDVGILKTLGVSRGQVLVAFISEGLLFGILGSALGIALGNALASAILRSIGRTVNALYVASVPQSIVLTPAIVATGIAVGVLLSLISAIQPAIEASQVPPNLLIRSGLQQRVPRAQRGPLVIAAIVAFAIALACARMPAYRGLPIAGYISVLFVVIGFSLLSPLVITYVSQWLKPVFGRLFGILGSVAAASMPASLRRTSVATAALAVAIGMMISVAVMVGSFRETVKIWVGQTVKSDLWLRPAKGLSNAGSAAFPDAITEDLRKVPYIAAFDRVRGRDVVYENNLISVGSGDFEAARQFGDLPMIAPRRSSDALTNALHTNGVLVSESFSIKFAKNVGDVVALRTARGIDSFPIAGVYRDYSNDRGVVFMDRALYVRAFRDDAINTVVIFLKPGMTADRARPLLEAQFGPTYHAFVVLNREIRTEVMRIFDQTFAITYALLGVAVIVAVLGIINTLSALILERTRELALLRVLGTQRGEVRLMLVLESVILGLTSTVSGIAMGYILSFVLIYVINKQSFGWTIEFHSPVALVSASVAVTFAAALIAGILPSRLAGRIEPAAALKAE